jgi:hypothetical protein
MLTPHGWKSRLSPRRGFTVLQAQLELSPPVVLALHSSVQALGLFRSAVEEAMGRGRRLVVIDYGSVPLHDLLWDESEDVDPRESKALRAVWANPNVQVTRVDNLHSGISDAVSYCEAHEAALLIVAAEVLGSLANDQELSPRIFSGDFDLLVLTDNQELSAPENLDEESRHPAERVENGG